MITSRTNPRRTVLHWLAELRQTARADKAEITCDKISDISQAMLSMVASSDAAPAAEMAELVERPDFHERALRYMMRNWALNTGLPAVMNDSQREIYDCGCRHHAMEAINMMISTSGRLERFSGPVAAELTTEVARKLSAKDLVNHGEGSGILLREALGLPGDEESCKLITEPAQLANALLALRKLGVEVAPSAFDSIDQHDPEKEHDLAPGL